MFVSAILPSYWRYLLEIYNRTIWEQYIVSGDQFKMVPLVVITITKIDLSKQPVVFPCSYITQSSLKCGWNNKL